jgi:NAD-dependent dihydropyrimidine dehydrogenase PreA subunit
MIELVIQDRCTGCGKCVQVCPTNVFDFSGERPSIARQEDCQTCFLCELYCTSDALYVAPNAERATPVNEAEILASGLLGEYRRDSGWDEWRDLHPNLFWRQGELFARGRQKSAPEKTEDQEPHTSRFRVEGEHADQDQARAGGVL